MCIRDRDNTVDIFEFTSNRILYTGTTSAAYQVYVKEGVDILESVNNLNGQIQDAFDFSGLKDDPSDITNDSTNVRTPIRLMQPYGLAYAYGCLVYTSPTENFIYHAPLKII